MPTLAKKFSERIEDWSDERKIGNGVIITVHWGWSFEHCCHEGVRGFDSISEAQRGVRDTYPCSCESCLKGLEESEAARKVAPQEVLDRVAEWQAERQSGE